MALLGEDMATYLTGKNLVEGAGVDFFIDVEPAVPDNCVMLYEYPGDPYNPYSEITHRSFQLMVRNKSTDEARALSVSIYESLMSPNFNVQLTADRLCQVYLRNPPFKLKTDENNRTFYCFNIGITTTID